MRLSVWLILALQKTVGKQHSRQRKRSVHVLTQPFLEAWFGMNVSIKAHTSGFDRITTGLDQQVHNSLSLNSLGTTYKVREDKY